MKKRLTNKTHEIEIEILGRTAVVSIVRGAESIRYEVSHGFFASPFGVAGLIRDVETAARLQTEKTQTCGFMGDEVDSLASIEYSRDRGIRGFFMHRGRMIWVSVDPGDVKGWLEFWLTAIADVKNHLGDLEQRTKSIS